MKDYRLICIASQKIDINQTSLYQSWYVFLDENDTIAIAWEEQNNTKINRKRIKIVIPSSLCKRNSSFSEWNFLSMYKVDYLESGSGDNIPGKCFCRIRLLINICLECNAGPRVRFQFASTKIRWRHFCLTINRYACKSLKHVDG